MYNEFSCLLLNLSPYPTYIAGRSPCSAALSEIHIKVLKEKKFVQNPQVNICFKVFFVLKVLARQHTHSVVNYPIQSKFSFKMRPSTLEIYSILMIIRWVLSNETSAIRLVILQNILNIVLWRCAILTPSLSYQDIFQVYEAEMKLMFMIVMWQQTYNANLRMSVYIKCG